MDESFLNEDVQWSLERSTQVPFTNSLFARMEAKQAKLREVPPLVDKATGKAHFHQAESANSGPVSSKAVSYESSLFARLVQAQKDAWYLPDPNAFDEEEEFSDELDDEFMLQNEDEENEEDEEDNDEEDEEEDDVEGLVHEQMTLRIASRNAPPLTSQSSPSNQSFLENLKAPALKRAKSRKKETSSDPFVSDGGEIDLRAPSFKQSRLARGNHSNLHNSNSLDEAGAGHERGRGGKASHLGSMPSVMKRQLSRRSQPRCIKFGIYSTESRTQAETRPAISSAVSLQFLMDFFNKLSEQEGGGHAATLTTLEVVMEVIIPKTTQRSCSYISSGLMLEEDVSSPTFFVVHSWSLPFISLIEHLMQFTQGLPFSSVFFWIDIFAINFHLEAMEAKRSRQIQRDLDQTKNSSLPSPTSPTSPTAHRPQQIDPNSINWEYDPHHGSLLPGWIDALISASTSTLILMDEVTYKPFTEPWHLYQISATVKLKGWSALEMIQTGQTKGADLSALHHSAIIDIDAAIETSRRKGAQARSSGHSALSPLLSTVYDKASLDTLVSHIHKSQTSSEFNDEIRLALWLAPSDMRGDVKHLLQSCSPTPPTPAITLSSSHSPPPPPPSVSSFMWMNTRRLIEWVNLPTNHSHFKSLAIIGNAGSGKSCLSAAIVSGCRETAPLPIHAYYFTRAGDQTRSQPLTFLRTLAHQLSLKFPFLKKDLVKRLSQYVPLHKLSLARAFKMLLKEPLDKIQTHFRTRGASEESSYIYLLFDGLDEPQVEPNDRSSGPSARSREGDFGPLLSLLIDHLHSFPSSVRFILTGGAERQLRAFNAMILRPFELQMEHEINLTLCSFYDKLVKLSGPPNNESSPDQMQPPPPPASQVVTSVMKGSGKGSILYSTICILDFVTHKLNKTNTEDPKNDSEGDAAIGVKPIQDYSIKGMLYGAYETLFRSHAAGSEMNVLSNAEAIRDLLQVLCTAREPLPLSLLEDLGLRDYLTLLPGWGLLWFVEGVHVRTFHSSTLQWLTQPVELEVKDEASPPDELMMQQDNPWESLTDRSSLVSPVVTSPSPSPSPLPSLLYVDPLLGHQALAHLSFMDLLGELGGGEGEDLEFSLDAPSDPKRRALRGYSLRHALAHSCLANDLAGTMRLAFLISYWQRLIADGHFSDVLSSLETFVDTREGTLRLSLESMLKRSSSTTSMNDLSALNTTPPPSVSASGMSHSNSGGRRSKGLSKNHAMREAKLDYTQLMSIREVIHWLRASSSFILKHPQSLPQLAQRAPRDSHVSHATGACSRVLQFDRAHKWNQVPQCQLEGKHTAQVTVVAVGPTRAATAFLTAQSKKPSVGGRAEEAAASLPLLIATGSCDGSIRIWDATISPVDESLGHKLSILVQERKNQQSQDGKSRSSNGSMRLSQTSKVHASHPPLPPPSTSNQPSWLQLQQGREVACLIGHSSEVHSIAFVPDTLNIVSVGKDLSMRFWGADSYWSTPKAFNLGPCVERLLSQPSSLLPSALGLKLHSPSTSSPSSPSHTNVQSDKDKRSRQKQTSAIFDDHYIPPWEGVGDTLDAPGSPSRTGEGSIKGSSKGSSKLPPLFTRYSLGPPSPSSPSSPSATLNAPPATTAPAHTEVVHTLGHSWSHLVTLGHTPAHTEVDHTLGHSWSHLVTLGHTPAHTEVVQVNLSPDGSLILTSHSNGTVALWDSSLVIKQSSATVPNVSLSPLILRLGCPPLCFSPYSSPPSSSSLSSSSPLGPPSPSKEGSPQSSADYIATCLPPTCTSGPTEHKPMTSEDVEVAIWEAMGKHRVKATLNCSSRPLALSLSPGSRIIAASFLEGDIILYDVFSGGLPMFTLVGHSSPVTSLCFSHCGKFLASGGRDRVVIIWESLSGKKMETAIFTGLKGTVSCLTWTKDGSKLIGGSEDCSALVWDVHVIISHSGRSRALAQMMRKMSEGGALLSADPSLQSSLNTKLPSLPSLPKLQTSRPPSSLSPARERQVVERSGPSGLLQFAVERSLGSNSGQLSPLSPPPPPTGPQTIIRNFSFQSKAVIESALTLGEQEKEIDPHPPSYIRTAMFNDQGSILLLVNVDNEASLWSTEDGAHLATLTGSSRSNGVFAFSPSSRLVTSTLTQEPSLTMVEGLMKVGVWDAATGHMTVLNGKNASFSPDSRFLAICSPPPHSSLSAHSSSPFSTASRQPLSSTAPSVSLFKSFSFVSSSLDGQADGKANDELEAEADVVEPILVIDGCVDVSFAPDSKRAAGFLPSKSQGKGSGNPSSARGIRLFSLDQGAENHELRVLEGSKPLFWSPDCSRIALRDNSSKAEDLWVLYDTNLGRWVGKVKGQCMSMGSEALRVAQLPQPSLFFPSTPHCLTLINEPGTSSSGLCKMTIAVWCIKDASKLFTIPLQTIEVPKGRTRIGATLVIPPQPLPLLPKALDSPSKGTSNLFHTYVLIVPTFEDHDHALSPNHHPSAMIRNDRGNRLLSQDDLFEDAGAEPRLESISLTPRNIPSLKSMSQLLSGPQPQSGSKSQSGPQELTGCLVDISMGVLVKRIQIRSSSLAAFSPGHNSILALASPSALSTITLLNTRQGNEICHLVVKSPTTTAAIELDGEFTPDGIITSFSFSPRGQFVAAQISSADPAVDFKTNDGVGKDKPARSWLYLWRVKGEAQEYEEEKFDQVGNPIHASFETPIWRSEESSVLIRDSYSWSHFFSRWETFNETPSLSPAYLTYSCNEGNIIAILSPPTPPPPSSDPMDATDITDSSSGDRSSQQLLALASDRKRTSNGELRERLMGPASTIVKIYSETPVVSSVICGRVLLGSGSVAVMEGREVGATLGKVVYYDNVHAWLVR